MNYKSEAKEVLQNYYGGYCEMCNKLNINKVPYYNFRIEIYKETKKLMKSLS